MKKSFVLSAAFCGLLSCLCASSANATTILPYNGSGLRLWLQADEGLTLDTVSFPDRVIGWADTTGTGGNNVAQDGVGPSGQRPLWIDNQLNGKPIVHFDTAARRVIGDAILPAGGGDKTIIAVARSSNTTNTNIFDPNGQGGGSGAVIRVTPEVSARFGNGRTDALGGLLNGFEMITVMTGATVGDTDIFRGGILSTGLIVSPDNSINTGVAGYQLGSKGFTGDIAELIVFDEKLGTHEQNRIGFYLQEKYAINFTPIIPEPTTATLALLGMGGMMRRRRRIA